MAEMIRLCKRCGLNKSVFYFTITDRVEDGFYDLCKKCREKTGKYYVNDKYVYMN